MYAPTHVINACKKAQQALAETLGRADVLVVYALSDAGERLLVSFAGRVDSTPINLYAAHKQGTESLAKFITETLGKVEMVKAAVERGVTRTDRIVMVGLIPLSSVADPSAPGAN